MGKILLNTAVHRIILFLIGYLVAKHQIDKEVADKLMRGDTAPLYAGGAPVSLMDIVNFAIAIIIALGSWLLASWRRVKDKFLILAASRMHVAVSQENLAKVVTETPNLTIIKTVANAQKNESQTSP